MKQRVFCRMLLAFGIVLSAIPYARSDVTMTDAECFAEVHDVEIAGKYAFVVGTQNTDAFSIVDISEGQHPRIVFCTTDERRPMTVAIRDGLAFVAGRDLGIYRTDPPFERLASIPLLSYWDLFSAIGQRFWHGRGSRSLSLDFGVNGMDFRDDGRLFLASKNGYVIEVDVDDPRTPKVVNVFDASREGIMNPHDIVMAGDLALVVDIQRRSERPVAALDTARDLWWVTSYIGDGKLAGANRIARTGDTVFVVSVRSNTIAKLRIDDQRHLSLEKVVPLHTEGGTGLAVVGERVIVGTLDQIEVFDLDLNPRKVMVDGAGDPPTDTTGFETAAGGAATIDAGATRFGFHDMAVTSDGRIVASAQDRNALIIFEADDEFDTDG